MIARHPIAYHLRYLQTLAEVSAEQNSTLVIPIPIELLSRSRPPSVRTSMFDAPLHGTPIHPHSCSQGFDRAALVTPLSGPLSRFGRATAAALALWAEEAADLPSPFTRVDLETHDAHPDSAGAMRAAAASGPSVLFGPYGSGPA